MVQATNYYNSETLVNLANISRVWIEVGLLWLSFLFFYFCIYNIMLPSYASIVGWFLFSSILQSFTDGAALLCSLAQRRQAELCQNRQRERIITALSLLKKSIPSLSVALQSYIKYPKNQQAQVKNNFSLCDVCLNTQQNVSLQNDRYMYQ